MIITMIMLTLIVKAGLYHCQVTDVAFAEDSSMFVTVGNRHVKFWYLDASKSKVPNIFWNSLLLFMLL